MEPGKLKVNIMNFEEWLISQSEDPRTMYSGTYSLLEAAYNFVSDEALKEENKEIRGLLRDIMTDLCDTGTVQPSTFDRVLEEVKKV